MSIAPRISFDGGQNQVFASPENIWHHIDVAMVRDRSQYTYQQGPKNWSVGTIDAYEKIQLGAGFKHLNGWRNLEYPDWDADLPIPSAGNSARKNNLDFEDLKDVGNAQDGFYLSQRIQRPNSVSEIASYHTLDHLSPKQVIQTLREVERVLVPGGTFTNIVPHADSQLAKECIHHQSRFMIDTWRNIFSERQYAHDGNWKLDVRLNFVFGLAERNTVLVTQLVKVES